jgi:hypothetical protein
MSHTEKTPQPRQASQPEVKTSAREAFLQKLVAEHESVRFVGASLFADFFQTSKS